MLEALLMGGNGGIETGPGWFKSVFTGNNTYPTDIAVAANGEVALMYGDVTANNNGVICVDADGQPRWNFENLLTAHWGAQGLNTHGNKCFFRDPFDPDTITLARRGYLSANEDWVVEENDGPTRSRNSVFGMDFAALGNNGNIYAAALNENNGDIAVGGSISTGSTRPGIEVRQSNGALRRKYSGYWGISGNHHIIDLSYDGTGNLIYVGHRDSNTLILGSLDPITGNQNWHTALSTSSLNMARVKFDSLGNIFVATSHNSSSNRTPHIFKFNSSGTLLAGVRYGTGAQRNELLGFDIDDNDNLWIANGFPFYASLDKYFLLSTMDNNFSNVNDRRIHLNLSLQTTFGVQPLVLKCWNDYIFVSGIWRTATRSQTFLLKISNSLNGGTWNNAGSQASDTIRVLTFSDWNWETFNHNTFAGSFGMSNNGNGFADATHQVVDWANGMTFIDTYWDFELE